MSPIETIAIVAAVYAVVFLAHRATQVTDDAAESSTDEVPGTANEVPLRTQTG